MGAQVNSPTDAGGLKRGSVAVRFVGGQVIFRSLPLRSASNLISLSRSLGGILASLISAARLAVMRYIGLRSPLGLMHPTDPKLDR